MTIYIIFKQLTALILFIMIAESITWAFSIVSQQKYLNLFNINDRRIHTKSSALTIFSLISMYVSLTLQVLQFELQLSGIDVISVFLAMIVFLYGSFIPYIFYFVATYLRIPVKNFPCISKFFIYVIGNIYNMNLNSYYKYENCTDNTLLVDFLDITADMVQIKDEENKYTFVNKPLCENILKYQKHDVLGKSSIDIATDYRKDGNRTTFGEMCFESDEITKKNRKPTVFFEYGYIGDDYKAVQVLKSPVWEADKIVGTIGIGRDVSNLIKQQDEIEKYFTEGRIDEGISKFLTYHQQFKSLKNINLEHKK